MNLTVCESDLVDGQLTSSRSPVFPKLQASARLERLLWTFALAFLLLLSAIPPFSRLLERIVDEP